MMKNSIDRDKMRKIAIQIHSMELGGLSEESGMSKQYVLSDKFHQRMELLIAQIEKKQFRKKRMNIWRGMYSACKDFKGRGYCSPESGNKIRKFLKSV